MRSAEAIISEAKEQRQKGNSPAAELRYGEAADVALSEGANDLRAHALRHVAELAAERGAGLRALEAADAALAIYESQPGSPPLDIANAQRVRALALAASGQSGESAQAWQSARALYEQLGIEAGVAECDRRLRSL